MTNEEPEIAKPLPGCVAMLSLLVTMAAFVLFFLSIKAHNHNLRWWQAAVVCTLIGALFRYLRTRHRILIYSDHLVVKQWYGSRTYLFADITHWEEKEVGPDIRKLTLSFSGKKVVLLSNSMRDYEGFKNRVIANLPDSPPANLYERYVPDSNDGLVIIIIVLLLVAALIYYWSQNYMMN